MAEDLAAAKTAKRMAALENEKSFMVSLEREGSWLNVEP